ncbi:elongation factor Tu [Flavobacterium magnum]|uniref:Elongation factor Tu n=1 Tax=Flavobacterium magnum TaxID=2162713 RepID=A0A2S0RGK6_9FLAO|nr:elongation factor Tu [Flavobacterium magnum]AWA31067.1 elongation factor Tu [Flavobacterium magnum]
MDNNPHFIAELKYLKTEDGGRKTAAKSGYRPQVQFDFEKMSTSGSQKFVDKEIVFPGESVLAEITLLSPQFFEYKLKVGMQFNFHEGPIIVGSGKILELKDEKLIAVI